MVDTGRTPVHPLCAADRYETARVVAAKCAEENDAYDGVAFVATGANFPDALGASALAAAKGWPTFLVDPRVGVDAALVSALKVSGVSQIVVLGGTAVVSDKVKSDLATQAPCRADRWWGIDRYATAAEVAKERRRRAAVGRRRHRYQRHVRYRAGAHLRRAGRGHARRA